MPAAASRAPAAGGKQLEGVGQFGQVADAVQAVGAGQRLPRAVGRGQRPGVGRHQRRPGRRYARAEQHHRHVGGQRVRQHRTQPGRVPDRLEDQGQHPGLRQAERVPGVVRGGGDEFLAGRDGQAEAEAAARPQQRGEHRTRVGDQRDRPWVQVGLDVADGPQPAGDVHEPHAPRAAHGHARFPGRRGQPLPSARGGPREGQRHYRKSRPNGPGFVPRRRAEPAGRNPAPRAGPGRPVLAPPPGSAGRARRRCRRSAG